MKSPTKAGVIAGFLESVWTLLDSLSDKNLEKLDRIAAVRANAVVSGSPSYHRLRAIHEFVRHKHQNRFGGSK